MDKNKRIVRVPLPVELIRAMDELVLEGLGGFQTRAEFIREAVESLVMELKYETAPDEHNGKPTAEPPASPRASPTVEERNSSDIERPPSLDPALGDQLKLQAPKRGTTIEEGAAEISREPLFGLHNRDYPSLWALQQLAKLAEDGPIEVGGFYREVTDLAWRIGDYLQGLGSERGQKVDYLFPTNTRKPQSAESRFQSYAIGYVSFDNGTPQAWGPLFLWQACQVVPIQDGFAIGMTDRGLDLLESLEGLSPIAPHTPTHAISFFDYLRRLAEPDWTCFRLLLLAIEPGSNRMELVESLRKEMPEWKEGIANTYTAGYVARSREWGLLEPKLFKGEYRLTEFGSEQVRAWKEIEV